MGLYRLDEDAVLFKKHIKEIRPSKRLDKIESEIAIKDFIRSSYMNTELKRFNFSKIAFGRVNSISIKHKLIPSEKYNIISKLIITSLIPYPIKELKLDDYSKDAAIAIATGDMEELTKTLAECGINAATILGKRLIKIIKDAELLMRKICKNASLDKHSKFTFSHIQLVFLNLTTRRMEIYIQAFRKGSERVRPQFYDQMKDNRLNEAMSINDITIKDLPKAIVMNSRELNIAKDQFRKTIDWSIMENDFQILDVVEATKPKLLKNNVIYTLTLRPYLEDQNRDFLSQAADILKKLVINVFSKRNIKEALIDAGLEAGSLILRRIVDILFMCEKLMREVCKTINSKSKYFRFYHIQTVLYNATNTEMTFHIQAFKRYRNLFIPDID